MHEIPKLLVFYYLKGWLCLSYKDGTKKAIESVTAREPGIILSLLGQQDIGY